MTPADRSKLARIAAYNEFIGKTPEQIEAYLYSVSPALSPAVVQRAMAEGTAGLNLAGLINQGTSQDIADFLSANAAEGIHGYDVLVRYQTGTDAAHDWRSVTLTVYGSQSLADVAAAVEARIGQQRQDEGYGRYAPGGQVQAPEVVFAVPVFTEG